MAANDGELRIVVARPRITRAKLKLYDRFHEFQHVHRGWPVHTPETGEEYADSFIHNPYEIQEWRYYLGKKLVGVGYVDALPQALSAIYFYYEPAERHRSLGIYNVLSLIRSARDQYLPYVYLGYYVKGCRSLEYKAQFRPHELLQPDGTWQLVPA
jgi:arginine-tRNA-protein transferase